MDTASNQRFETRCLSSLTKVFADEELRDEPFSGASALREETFSFQVAFRSDGLIKRIRVHAAADKLEDIRVRRVGLVPSELPCYEDHDDDILRKTPGLYPDPLYPIDDCDGINAFPHQWRAIWVTVKIHQDVPAGRYPINVLFHADNGERLGQETFTLEVIEASLPKQELIHTEWFYADCLATWYGVEVFSEAHWKWIESYVENAAGHGINMILTPIFTPALETEVGHERPTVQLVDVTKHGSQYSFDFHQLDRWIKTGLKNGIQYFEFAHLFTQWGAKHAPKIIVEENDQPKQLFGWDTSALGADYLDFLAQFLPELTRFIEEHELKSHVYFHISDEPGMADLEHYKQITHFVKSYIGDYPIIDALSDYEFYQSGAVTTPVPSNDRLDAFLEQHVENLWTYYCCGQYKGVSNRFLNMPSSRNRVIGTQLYKFHMKGFLHWGYNHWYSQKSLYALNPFVNTDAGAAFPSGDAFLVYPGETGPIDSIRLEVFHEALQDQRALQMLERIVGRDQTLEILEGELAAPITFCEYPRDSYWILSMREKLNQCIKLNLPKMQR